MGSRIYQYFHAVNSTGTTALTTAFPATPTRTIDLTGGQVVIPTSRWVNFLESVLLHVDTIAAGATKLTLRITTDAAGDVCLIPDVQATIATGITTATKGSVGYTCGFGLPNTAAATVYLWVKTDAGTCNLGTATLTWRE